MKKTILKICILFLSIQTYAQNGVVGDLPGYADPVLIGEKLVKNYLASDYRHFDEIPGDPPYIVYPETCTWLGALVFSEKTNNTALLMDLEKRFFPLLGKRKELMQKPNHVDNTVFGVIPLRLYMLTDNPLYYHIGIDFADRQWQLPKSSASDSIKHAAFLDRGLSWQTRFWIDDMYMITAIQSHAYLATKDRKYIDRAAYEMTVYLDSIQKPNGLFYHAQQAPFFWGRGNGWMAAGMTELLRNLPKDSEYYSRILTSYQRMMHTLKLNTNKEGLWGQLVDEPTESWTETSGSAMFTYAMIAGVKEGWLDRHEYVPVVRKAWLALMPYINDNGDLRDVCIGTNIGSTKEHYLNRRRLVGDFHGQAALLWCASALLPEEKQ
ncbi:glycoside hydrolase family 88/105 protein [Sphingobacterium arenae]|uniref:Glycoside hydrolase family 88 protein n=1 Tax=Sphingobacterium arenae TaxID=1280598 RepID=A0ABR7Y6T9_9SPHI|nr:glycoside hydrolase family 88 protein [Sphingobacterium arenae]MBD1427014.1 glycoside hydrolase family 88 protein [Sphingobacterium arenae]